MIAITLVLTAVSVLLALMFAPSFSDTHYAVLKIDEAVNDAVIVASLHENGISNIESASTQTVFLNDFSGITDVSLNQYDDYVFDFDPRNDGYSAKIKRFFYQDGKQLIFIPLKNQKAPSRLIIKTIDEVLANIPYELQFIGTSMPKKLPGVLFLAALAGIFYFFKKLSPVRMIFFPMAGFLFFGSSGFILSALLTVFFSILINPLRELFTSRSLGTKRNIREYMYLYRYSWISALGCVVLYVSVTLLTSISIVYSVILFAALSGLCAFSLHHQENRGKVSRHTRFLPVPISGEKINLYHHSFSALPFTIAAVILLFSSIFMGQSSNQLEFDQTRLVTKTDFEEHVRFQQNFSFIPLGETMDHHQYKNYQIGDDGLVLNEGILYSEDSELIDSMLFPLEDLIQHLQGRSTQTIQWISWKTIIPLGFFLFLAFLAFFAALKNRGRKKMISMYNDKRIAA
jgi:hypothetical protein